MAIRRSIGFGDLLRRYRKRSGLTQEQLAERAGLSVRGISDLERGVNQAPYRSTVTRLADALALRDDDRAALERVSSRFGTNQANALLGTTASGQSAPSAPLVGRERERDLVRQHLEGKLSPLLAIAGEPGIGKTRLLDAARGLAVERGLPVLSAGCLRPVGEQPYTPLGDALSAYAHQLTPPELRSALKGCWWLTRLLPELTELVRAPQFVGDLSPDAERRLVTGAVTRFLQNVAGPQGVILVLDDLQWAGRSALELLLALCRSAHEAGLRIVCAYRSTEVSAPDPVSTMLADAAHAGFAHQLFLAPLSSAESSRLIDALGPPEISPRARQHLLDRSGGVPFFLVSCASALRAHDVGEGEIPWTVGQSVRQRVAALSALAREVLRVAAIAGQGVPAGVIMTVIHEPRLAIVGAIDEACRAGLLTERDVGSYAFSHDVIREVVELDLGGARRMSLHLAVGEALERARGELGPREAAELAWHFGRGQDQRRALRYALLAGDHAASLYAHRDAAELYAAAAGYAVTSRDEGGEAEASERAGRELTLLADYGAAVSFLDRAASLYRKAGDIESEARVIAQLGWTHFYRATPSDAVARVESLVQHLWDQPDSASLARLCITLTFLWYADRPVEALTAAERACRVAEDLGDEYLLAAARVRHGLVLGRTGRWDDGERVLVGAAELAENIGDVESQAYALEFAGIACRLQGKLEECREYYERALEPAERLGDPTALAYGLRSCGSAHFDLGNWEKARTYYERARAVDASTFSSAFSALIPLQAMELALAQGRCDDVDRLAEECLAREHAQRNDRIDTNLLCLLAERDLLRNAAESALHRLAPRLDDFYADEKVNLGVRTTPIDVCIATGDVDRADKLTCQYADLIAEQGNRRLMPAMLRARGAVRAAQGRLEEAEEAFAEAAELASQMQHIMEYARILLEWAKAARSGGDRKRLAVSAAEAENIFQRLGAVLYAAQTRRVLEEAQLTNRAESR